MGTGNKKRRRSGSRSSGAVDDGTPALVAGYNCLPVLKRVVVGDDNANVSELKSCLYYRRHYGKRLRITEQGDSLEMEGDEHASLFVTNLCDRITAVDLKVLFSQSGTVEDVGFGYIRSAGGEIRYAHVTFSTEEGVEKALSVGGNAVQTKPWALRTPAEGIEAWLSKHKDSVPSLSSLRAEADEYMVAFEKRLEDEKRELERRRHEADDDGFTVVKRKNTARKGGQQASNIAPRKKKKNTGELKDFYRFQMKEGKRNKLAELREQFEVDKLKVERLKMTDKFKRGIK
jgi:hypothetical protein